MKWNGCANSKKKNDFSRQTEYFTTELIVLEKFLDDTECEPVITQLDGANTSWSCRDDCCYHLLVIMAMVGHTLTEKKTDRGETKIF